MSGCLLCLHLDLGLKTGFEFKVEVVFVNRDPFDQPPDHPFKTENRAFAEYQWSYLDTQHSRGYASVRCMIPGKRKAFIKCPDTVPCATCPYKGKKQAPIISWDGLVETGYEPVGSAPVDEQVGAKMECEGIKAMMDAEDTRIARAFEMKELQGYSVREIAAELEISQPRVYQLIARAKTIGMEYRKIHG
jgi:hypothetical protein